MSACQHAMQLLVLLACSVTDTFKACVQCTKHTARVKHLCVLVGMPPDLVRSGTEQSCQTA